MDETWAGVSVAWRHRSDVSTRARTQTRVKCVNTLQSPCGRNTVRGKALVCKIQRRVEDWDLSQKDNRNDEPAPRPGKEPVSKTKEEVYSTRPDKETRTTGAPRLNLRWQRSAKDPSTQPGQGDNPRPMQGRHVRVGPEDDLTQCILFRSDFLSNTRSETLRRRLGPGPWDPVKVSEVYKSTGSRSSGRVDIGQGGRPREERRWWFIRTSTPEVPVEVKVG